MYTYRAKLIRVVDGDTVWLEVDLGFHCTHSAPFRLARINAPEHDITSTDALKTLLTSDAYLTAGYLTVETKKTDKYGRWLVEILRNEPVVMRPNETIRTCNVSDELLNLGIVKPYEH